MASQDKLQQLSALLEPTVNGLGCELWGIEYISQGKHSVLRVYIEKPEGISLEDCESVSHQVSALLDVEEPISGQYQLEVSSPGVERPLFKHEHFQSSIGQHIKVSLHVPVEQRRKYRGILREVTDDTLVIDVDNERVELPMATIEKAKLCWSE